MSLTLAQQYTAAKLGVAVFGAALGTAYLAEYEGYINAGGTSDNIWQAALNTGPAQEVYPSFLSDAQFAQRVIDNLLGNYVDVTYKTWGFEELMSLLKAGSTRGDVLHVATDYVFNQSPNNVMWGQAANALHNKVAVANYYTTSLSGSSTDVPFLRKLIAGVDNNTDTTSKVAIENTLLDAQQGSSPIVFSLGSGIDLFTGQSGNDTFTAVSNTLGAHDRLDGRGGFDTLIINDASNTALVLPATLSLENIERLDISHSATSSRQTVDLDLRAYSGFKEVHAVGTGMAVTTNLAFGGGVTTLSAKHVAALNITASSDASALKTLDLSDVSGIVNLYAKLAVLDINLMGNADVYIASPAFHTASIYADALGALALNDSTVTALTVENLGAAKTDATLTLSTASLTQLTLRGDFNATLNTPASGLKTLDAGATSGSLQWTAAFLDGAISGKLGLGNNTVDTSSAKGMSSWTAGAGNDTIRVVNSQNNVIDAGGGNNTVTTGSGNDTITIGAGKSVIRSGPGMDKIKVGLGDHTFVQAANKSGNVYSEIMGFGHGDKLQLATVSGATLDSTAIVSTGAATYESLLAQASADVSAHVSYFAFEGNTYLVSDVSSATTFQDGKDQVVKLVGMVDFSQSTWDSAMGTLTL